MPKRNSELIGNRGWDVDDAARPEIGDKQGRDSFDASDLLLSFCGSRPARGRS
jgi:hypothetical protein